MPLDGDSLDIFFIPLRPGRPKGEVIENVGRHAFMPRSDWHSLDQFVSYLQKEFRGSYFDLEGGEQELRATVAARLARGATEEGVEPYSRWIGTLPLFFIRIPLHDRDVFLKTLFVPGEELTVSSNDDTYHILRRLSVELGYYYSECGD